MKYIINLKRSSFVFIATERTNSSRNSSPKTYSDGFFHPVRWSYGNKPFGNKSEDDDEFRRISNSSKSSDKAL